MPVISPPTLSARWEALRAERPGMRTRDAADSLGVSELELESTRVGGGVDVLEADARAIFGSLPRLGPVMALTRNRHAVIEKDGTYTDLRVSHGTVGGVLGTDIDLRVFLHNLRYALAVTLPKPGGDLHGVAFYDASGEAMHKIWLRPESDLAAWSDLVRRHRAPGQQPVTRVEPPPEPARPGVDVDVDGFQAGWRAMQDTHEHFMLLRQFGVTRHQSLTLAPEGMTHRAGDDAFLRVLEGAAEAEIPIMVFVGSRGVIEIHSGPVRRVVQARGWLNVLDPGFNLHVRESGLAAQWLVRKPTADGVVTSLELYDHAGENVALLFGVRKPGQTEDPRWRELVERAGGLR